MSLNQVPFQQNTNQVLLPVTERLVQQETNVEFRLVVEGKDLVYSGNGSLYATDQRIIFRALKATPQLTSVFVPLYFCRKISLVQPLLFGANYITCDVVPFAGSNMNAMGQLRLTFNNGGAIEFHQHVRPIQLFYEQQAERAAASAQPPAYGDYAASVPVHSAGDRKEDLSAYQYPPAQATPSAAAAATSSDQQQQQQQQQGQGDSHPLPPPY